jgi:hypothetical protein
MVDNFQTNQELEISDKDKNQKKTYRTTIVKENDDQNCTEEEKAEGFFYDPQLGCHSLQEDLDESCNSREKVICTTSNIYTYIVENIVDPIEFNNSFYRLSACNYNVVYDAKYKGQDFKFKCSFGFIAYNDNEVLGYFYSSNKEEYVKKSKELNYFEQNNNLKLPLQPHISPKDESLGGIFEISTYGDLCKATLDTNIKFIYTDIGYISQLNYTINGTNNDTNSSLTKNVAIGIGVAAGIGIGALIAWFSKPTPKYPTYNNDGGNGPYDPPPPPPGGGDGPGGQSGSYNNFPTYYQPKHDNNPVKVSHLLSAGAGALFGVAGTGLAFILKSRGGSNSASSECSIDKHEQIKGLHKAFGMKGGFGMKYQGTINQDTLDSLTKGLPYSQEAEKCWENPVYDDLCNNVQTLGAYPICNIIQHHHC